MEKGIYGLGDKLLNYIEKVIEEGREKEAIEKIKKENPEMYNQAMEYMKNREENSKKIQEILPDDAMSAEEADRYLRDQLFGDGNDKH
ncbi:MAG: hypothetical protein K9J21_10815 [Bacteroidales bacterium]|nr:hypothetical protein [Bacteroidales bacterium]